MKFIRPVVAAATVLMLAAYVPKGAPAAVVAATAPARHQRFAGGQPVLSVMTWNVKGLPSPIALGRPAALAEIGRRLGGLRRTGKQPHVVLLQEAFISDAKAIGAEGGYPYAAIGPQPDDSSASPTAALGDAFRQNASWAKGEDEGKWLGSGLVILSDYPILATRKMAFPQDACAGFDCLAAKGVLLAKIAVPGATKPVTVIDTHLNSRHASGVSVQRANTAYAWQADAVRRFVARETGPDEDIVFGGDFNIGHDPIRRAAAGRNGGFLPRGREAIATVAATSPLATTQNADFVAVEQRAKDKQYFRPARGGRLELRKVDVPFGLANGGFDLSDHLGFVATYRIDDKAAE